MKTMILVLLASIPIALTGCLPKGIFGIDDEAPAKLVAPIVGEAPPAAAEEVPVPPFQGVTTVPTLNEVVERVSAALEGNANPNAGAFQTAVNLSGPSLFKTRDTKQLNASAIIATNQIIHGACASIPTATLGTAYGIQTGQSIQNNAAALRAFGLRILANTLLLTQEASPELFSRAGQVFDQQIASLAAGTFPANTNRTQAAAVSVCTAALQAGGFRLGS